MDKGSLDFGNDSVLNDPVLSRCGHGKRWDLCELADCREIWQLLQQQRKEQRRDEENWISAELAKKWRGKKSEYEIALEQKQRERIVNSDYEYLAAVKAEDLPDAIRTSDPKLFWDIFPDAITLKAAIQFKAVTLRQGQVLKEYFDADEGLPDYKKWDAIGKQIGFSGKTVEREFRVLLEKFFKAKATTGEREGAIEVVHVRGEPGLQYWRKQSIQFGEWKREWKELITDRKTICKLRQDGTAIIRSEKTPVPMSSGNELFAALIKQFAGEIPQDGCIRPECVSEADWEFNLRRAQRLLAEKKHVNGRWTAPEVATRLFRRGRLCRGCSTFLIRGFRINGRKITRAREYCDDACKMRAERRKKNRAGISKASAVS